MHADNSYDQSYYRNQFCPDHPSEDALEDRLDWVRDSLNIRFLPKSWEEFNEYSEHDQLEIVQTLSVVVEVFRKEFERTEFVQGVFQEYEWDLANLWEYCCDTCELPFVFCKC